MCSHDVKRLANKAAGGDQKADNFILCSQCDMLIKLPALHVGTKAICPRCKTMLSICWRDPHKRAIAFSLSALLMLILSNAFPFISMRVAGISNQIWLTQIAQVMIAEHYHSMATLFIVFVQFIPAFCMSVIFLLCAGVRMPIALKVWMARQLFRCRPWCMVEIFLAGVLVSFVKLMSYGDIGIGASFIPYCLFCLLQVHAFQCVDRHWLWQQIAPAPKLPQALQSGRMGLHQGLRSCSCCTAVLPIDVEICPRCQTKGHARRRHSVQWTLALLITSFMLYIPANLLPIMVTEALGHQITSTIMAGVILLWGSGSYPVALVIFIASIMVPSLKMVAIAWLCWDTKNSKRSDSERMHFIYDIVEFVGRWSMIDVFVIAVLATLVRIGKLMNIYPDIGVVLFGLVVILTMFSAMAFDPRLIWDHIDEKETSGNGKQQ